MATFTEVSKHYNLNQASAASHTCTLASLAVGNIITIPILWNATGRTIGTVSDTDGSTSAVTTWTENAEAINIGTTSIGFVSGKVTNTQASTVVTVAVVGGNSGGGNLWCSQWSTSTSWPAVFFDAVGAGATAGTTESFTGDSVTTAQNNELVLSVIRLANNRTVTITSSGWSDLNAGSNQNHLGTIQANTAGAQQVTGNWTGQGNSTYYIRSAAWKDNVAVSARRRQMITSS